MLEISFKLYVCLARFQMALAAPALLPALLFIRAAFQLGFASAAGGLSWGKDRDNYGTSTPVIDSRASDTSHADDALGPGSNPALGIETG